MSPHHPFHSVIFIVIVQRVPLVQQSHCLNLNSVLSLKLKARSLTVLKTYRSGLGELPPTWHMQKPILLLAHQYSARFEQSIPLVERAYSDIDSISIQRWVYEGPVLLVASHCSLIRKHYYSVGVNPIFRRRLIRIQQAKPGLLAVVNPAYDGC